MKINGAKDLHPSQLKPHARPWGKVAAFNNGHDVGYEEAQNATVTGMFTFWPDGKLDFTIHAKDFKYGKKALVSLQKEVKRLIDNQQKCPAHPASKTKKTP